MFRVWDPNSIAILIIVEVLAMGYCSCYAKLFGGLMVFQCPVENKGVYSFLPDWAHIVLVDAVHLLRFLMITRNNCMLGLFLIGNC